MKGGGEERDRRGMFDKKGRIKDERGRKVERNVER